MNTQITDVPFETFRNSDAGICQTQSLWSQRDEEAPYPNSITSDFPGVEQPGREADHSPPSRTEVKNSEAIPPLPHMP
jgi:hypothetical protein